MRVGKRDRRIVVERYTEIRNAYNEAEMQWAPLLNVWANLRTQSGKEALQAEQVVASDVVVFNIRFAALTTKDRVCYNGKVYDIQHLNEIGRQKELELICTTSENG